MEQSLCDKLNALPKEDRKRFCEELHIILNDRRYSAIYGLSAKDYAELPENKVQEVSEKLYNKMFNNKEKRD